MDRLAFLLLVFVVLLRSLLLKTGLPFSHSFTWPMLALSVLALVGNWKQAYDAEAWSVVAAQFLVPFAMFHLARAVFTTESAVQELEAFCIFAVAYLCFISIAFMSGQSQLIFPRFILDGGVEMHLDRARGPFLQAVANGVSINLLGLVVFDCYLRNRIRALVAVPLLLLVPIAVFATMTRSVWLAFILSLAGIAFFEQRRRTWTLLSCAVIATAVLMYVATANSTLVEASEERFQDRDTVDFRLSVYQLSWDMFRDRPLLGWGQGEFAREIETRISDFRPGTYAAHNTFIDIVIEHGTVGLLLYLWIGVSLFRLRKRSQWLQLAWPIYLAVYFVNACCVVMNYQFVNALLFTFAGVMAGGERTHAEQPLLQECLESSHEDRLPDERFSIRCGSVR
ncbi:MAG TPA: O-antigen ligase family protein [Terriglobales bacterium]|nr:O-antigen ligase family protein [Terriglobales bacterium]